MKLARFSNNILCFVIGFCFVYFTEIACGAFGRSAITTMERRFRVTMQHISYLALAYQVPNLFCLVLMGYLGQTHNRPRIICVCMIILAVAFFMNTLPHLLSKPYNYLAVGLETDQENTSQLCVNRNYSFSPDNFKTFQNRTESSSDRNSNMTPLFWFLIVSSSLTGIGASSFYPLGFTYVDDHSSEHKSALYIAIINTMGFIGNACGYALGGGFLKLWVDIDRTDTEKIDIEPEDPRWIGAWWLGFVVFGVLALFGALVMFAFPKEMKGKDGKKKKIDHKLQDVNESAELDEDSSERKKIVHAEQDVSSRNWKEPLIACKTMFQNPIYVFSLLCGLFGMSAQVAIVKLYPKYLEVVFGISASQTSYVFGVAVFPATAIATILSGVIMKRMKLERRGALMMCNISVVVGCVTFAALYHVGCDTIDIRGVTLSYSGETKRETSAQCNQVCGCEVGSYSPVCGSDATTYLSPCHAGCTTSSSHNVGNDTTINMVYHMCACINGSGTAQESVCEKSRCTNYFLLVVLLNTVGLVFGAIITTPFFMVVLRSVPTRDKSLAVGVTSLLVRAAGFIPSQLIFAAVIDSTCLYWSDVSEGGGYCKIYNNTLLRHRVFGVALAMQLAALVAVIAAQVFERREKIRTLEQAGMTTEIEQTEQAFSLLSRQSDQAKA